MGVERKLAEETNVPEYNVLQDLYAHQFLELLCGRILEENYLIQTIAAEGWNIYLERVKKLIRGNFHNQVLGMETLLYRLNGGYSLVLVSDHADNNQENLISAQQVGIEGIRFISIEKLSTELTGFGIYV